MLALGVPLVLFGTPRLFEPRTLALVQATRSLGPISLVMSMVRDRIVGAKTITVRPSGDSRQHNPQLSPSTAAPHRF